MLNNFCPDISNLKTLFGFVQCYIVKGVIPVLVAIAVLLFMIGITRYFIVSGGDEQAREIGKKYAITGLISLTVLFGIWGIIQIFQNTLFSSSSSTFTPVAPASPTSISPSSTFTPPSSTFTPVTPTTP